MPLARADFLSAANARQAIEWDAITPADSDLSRVPSWVSVNADGNVALRDYNDTDATVFLRAGVLYPLCPKQIRATSTTATGIIAWYGPADLP